MKYSTRQAAKELGLHYTTFHKYLREKKIPLPEMTQVAGVRVRVWSEADIKHARKLLPKIANGRKTRYTKQSALSNQQSTKTKAPARVPVPHKTHKPKKKK